MAARQGLQVDFILRCRLQGECVLARAGFGRVAEGLKDRTALVPVGELIGVVAAAQLAGLSGREDKNRFIPIAEIGDKAHRRAVAFRRRADAVTGTCLRFAADA